MKLKFHDVSSLAVDSQLNKTTAQYDVPQPSVKGIFQPQPWASWKAIPLEFAAAMQSEFVQAILVALLVGH